MYTFNIRVGNILGYTEPVQDPYNDSLNNILDSNIDDIMSQTIQTKLRPRQGALIMQSNTEQNVNIL